MFPVLLEVFSSNQPARQNLKIATGDQMDTFSMSSTCINCNKHITLGYACSFCLSLYCADKVGSYNPTDPNRIIPPACYEKPECIVCHRRFATTSSSTKWFKLIN